jgi:hypothetical protein
MKTFKDFINEAVILEKYYKPEDKLPSGKTPVEKAVSQNRKVARTIGTKSVKSQKRWGRHYDKIQTKVKHGADNPNYNDKVSHKHKGKISVNSDGDELEVTHKKSGIYFQAYKSNNSPDSHTIEWGHSKNRSSMSPRERFKLARTAKKVWDKHVSHRLPNDAIVHNSPSASHDKRGVEKDVNRRSRIYQRSGFGPLDSSGDQFAKTKREPSPKQKAKGKSRLTPLNPSKTKSHLRWGRVDDEDDDD